MSMSKETTIDDITKDSDNGSTSSSISGSNLDKDYHDLLDDIRQTLSTSTSKEENNNVGVIDSSSNDDDDDDDDDVLPPPPELDLSVFETQLFHSNAPSVKSTGGSSGGAISGGVGGVVNENTNRSGGSTSGASKNEPPATVVTLPVTTVTMVRDGDGTLTTSAAAAATSTTPSLKIYNAEEPQQQPIEASAPKPQYLTAEEVDVLPINQSSLPVLLVSTDRISQLIQQNNMNICELFTTLSRNLPNVFQTTLPPFRSVSKSVALTWDKVPLRFLDREAMDGSKSTTSTPGGGGTDAFKEFSIQEKDALDEMYPGKIVSLGQCQDHVECFLREENWKKNKKKGTDLHDYDKSSASKDSSDAEEIQEELIDNFLSHHYNPWLRRYRYHLDDVCQRNEIDMFSHPILVVLVVSSSEDYVSCLRELSNVHHFPKSFSNGMYDYNLVKKHFLVLSEEDREESLLANLRQSFPNQPCSVVRFNSGSGSEVEIPLGWTAKNPKGRWLSNRDKYQLRRFLSTLTSEYVLPTLERRIFHLNSIVNNAKRGVKNVFKTFWRKPKEGAAAVINTNLLLATGQSASSNTAKNTVVERLYTHDSVESQVRLLADSLFLIQDYENALAMYRLVKDDYKHDKATYHYASVQEMMALCYYLLDPYHSKYPREFQNCIENALYSYTRNASDGVKSSYNNHATRLCLVLSSFIVTKDSSHVDMADLIASTSSHEAPFGAAVLLERAAFHYLQSGYVRKFAFHVLMAGHMYRSSHQELHAMRCFYVSLVHYQHFSWPDLVAHLKSALAQQCYTLGNASTSFLLYWILLQGGGLGSMRSQQRYIQHFIDLARKFPEDALNTVRLTTSQNNDVLNSLEDSDNHNKTMLEIPNLGLPRVLDDLMRISMEDDFQYRPHIVSPERRQHSLFFNVVLDDDDDDYIHSNTAVNTNLVDLDEMEDQDGSNTNTPSNQLQGEDTTWQKITCLTEAELTNTPSSTTTTIPEVIENYQTISKEFSYMHYNQTKNAHKLHLFPYYGQAKRAKSEIIQVQIVIVNPLDVQLQFMDVQLIAKLECSSTPKTILGSNDIPFLTDATSSTSKKKQVWKYPSLKTTTFEIPAFYRHGSTTSTAVEHHNPCFIVDKQMMNMEPNVVKRMTLNIVPLMEGNLTILGFRCRLFGDIWTRHMFQVKGPLLQNTSYNRANRVRGESYLLKSKVESDMPQITVDFLHIKPFVLQGEVTKFILRLTNTGSAPACNVHLKMDVPCICLCTSSSSDTHHACNGCIGPTGTLFKLPLRIPAGGTTHTTASPDLIKLEDALQPNESIDIPCKLRVDHGGGKQDLYFLFRYDLFTKSEQHSSSNWGNLPTFSSNTTYNPKKKKVKHRFLRKLLSLAVYPSFDLHATIMPSYWQKREHILTLELTNYRSDSSSSSSSNRSLSASILDLFLYNVRIVSRFYRVIPLPNQMSLDVNANVAEDGNANEWNSSIPTHARRLLQLTHGNPDGVCKIGWQECVTLHYLVIPVEEDDDDNCHVVLSDCHLLSGNTSSDCGTIGHIASNHVSHTHHRTAARGGDDVSSSSLAIMDFLCLAQAHDKFEEAFTSYQTLIQRQAAGQDEKPRSIGEIRRANTELSSGNKQENSAPSDKDSSFFSKESSLTDGTNESDAVTTAQKVPVYSPTSIAALCPYNDDESILHIITSWSALSSTMTGSAATAGSTSRQAHHPDDILLRGQHHYPPLYVRPHHNPKICPLTITACHPSTVYFDFAQDSSSVTSFQAPLEITIRNRLVSYPVTFEFSLEHSPEFEILGMDSFTRILKGNEECIIPLTVMVFSPGIYNLQSVRLTVFVDTGGRGHDDVLKVPYLFPLQWIMKVCHKSITS